MQTCTNCGNLFNYYNRTATPICHNHHIVCKLCASALRAQGSKCPICGIGLLPGNRYDINNSISGHQRHHGHHGYHGHHGHQEYWRQQIEQPPEHSNSILNNEYAPGDGQQGQPQLGMGPIGAGMGIGGKAKTAKYCVLMLMFLMVGILLLTMRLTMQKCSFWGWRWRYATCNYQGYTYCCYGSCRASTHDIYYYCDPVNKIQNHGGMTAATVLASLCAFLALVMLVKYIVNRRANARVVVAASDNYVRV